MNFTTNVPIILNQIQEFCGNFKTDRTHKCRSMLPQITTTYFFSENQNEVLLKIDLIFTSANLTLNREIEFKI